MVESISISDVAQKVVTQTFAFGGSLHNPCNINNLKNCSDLGFGLEHFAKTVEALIRDWYDGLVGFNSAEGIVLCGHMQIGKEVVGGRFADVGESHDTHPESVARSSPKDFLLLCVIFLLGWH